MKSLPTVAILLALAVVVIAGYLVGMNPATVGIDVSGTTAAGAGRSESPAHDSIRSLGLGLQGSLEEESVRKPSDEPGPVATSTRGGVSPSSPRGVPRANLFNRELPPTPDRQVIGPASSDSPSASSRAAPRQAEGGSIVNPANDAVMNLQAGPGGASAVDEPPRPLAPMPLVFRDLPPEVANDPQKLAVVQALQQSFVAAIGGPNQDPSDPAYLEQWRAAQRMSDQQYQLRIGAQAFLAAQMAANHQ